ncbi:hypothetical protein ACIP4Q_02260 [Streptomyces massasporeus]|uniref:hypothetical protein n=1 Tax=Streptomyces iakyrus TaxID=68219 RepID=UPI003686DC86
MLAGLTASGATFEEIAATTKLLIIGGMQEPRDLFGHALIAYLTDPAVRQEIDRDKPVIVRLIEGALRFGAPVGTVTRRVTKPTRIAGQLLDEGSLVLAVLASANRDRRRWDEPWFPGRARLSCRRRRIPLLLPAVQPRTAERLR